MGGETFQNPCLCCSVLKVIYMYGMKKAARGAKKALPGEKKELARV